MKSEDDYIVRLVSNAIVVSQRLAFKVASPFVLIWLCNSLFKTGIEYTLWNWWVITATLFMLFFKLEFSKEQA